MKKYFAFFFAFAAIATTAFSCTQEIDAPAEPAFEPLVLNAYVDDDVTSKTTFDGTSIIWTAQDAIAAFVENDAAAHTSTITTVTDEGKKASFVIGDIGSTSNVSMALYPYDEDATIDADGLISTTIPTEQNIVAGSFANGANVAIAHGGTDNLKFRNVGAFLCLTVSDDNIRSIKLSANENMTGDVLIDYNNGEPSVQANSASGKSMQKYVELKGEFIASTKYYFVVAPGTYTGIQITLTDANGRVATLKNNTQLEVTRNDNVIIGSLPLVRETAWNYIFDFTSDSLGLPASATTVAGVYNYSLGSSQYPFYFTKNGKGIYGALYQESYFLMVNSGEYIRLPYFSGKRLNSVSIHNTVNCSVSTVVDIVSNMVSNNSVSQEGATTFSKTDSNYSFQVPSSYSNKPYYICVKDKNCQISSLSLTYDISNEIFAPVTLQMSDVTCTEKGVSYLVFSWEPVVGAMEYSISLDGVEKTAVKTNSYRATGLAENSVHTISVNAIGDGSDYLDATTPKTCTDTTGTSNGNQPGDSYLWTFASGDLGATGSPLSSVEKGNPALTWSATYKWGSSDANKYFAWDNTKGLQVGSGSSTNKCSSLVLTTSEYSGYVESIVVNASHANSGGATVSVSVGGVSLTCFNKETISCTTSATNYTFTSTEQPEGDIVVTIGNSKAKAFYLKSISINPVE